MIATSERKQAYLTEQEEASLREILVYEIDKLSFCLYCKSNIDMHENLKSILAKVGE